jgi:hypothetical protein
MAKLSLNNISAGFASTAALNANFDAIETAIENTVSRDGTTPNQMTADLDMNSNGIINLASLDVDSLSINGVLVIPTGTTAAEIPTQSGQDNKFLQTNGTVVSWQVPEASEVSYTPSGTGAVDTTVQSKLRESVSVKDFGAVGDGVTDDTAAIQAALDYWVLNQGDLTFPPGRYLISDDLLASFAAANSTRPKRISGYGAEIVTTSDIVDALTISVSALSRVIRYIFVEGLQITGSYTGTALQMFGPKANTAYLYNCVLRDITTSGNTGIALLGNFFESSVENCHVSASATGYGIYISTDDGEDVGGSGGTISSVTLYQNSTRGGINGVLCDSSAADVNIIGGTYLTAQEYGIRLNTAQGGHITGAHVEQSWQSNKVNTAGQAGIYAVISATFAIKNTYSINNYGHAVRVYVGGGGCAILDSGFHSGGLEEFYIWGAANSSAILNGAGDYTTLGTIAITQNTGLRTVVPIESSIVTRLNNPATVTPSAAGYSYQILLNAVPTINAPSFTPQYGDELEFSFEQVGAGGTTVTWDAVYSVGAFVPTAAFNKTSTIRFKYLNTSFAGAKWVVVSTGTN